MHTVQIVYYWLRKMEDVTFGSGEIIFVSEFSTFARIDRTLRVVGSLSDFDAKAQRVALLDPENLGCRVIVDTQLLASVRADSGEGVVAMLGECAPGGDGGFVLKARLLLQLRDIKYETYRKHVLKRRRAISGARQDDEN